MDFMIRLTDVIAAINRIGVNYNQTVKQVHKTFGPARAKVLLADLTQKTDRLLDEVQKVREIVHQFGSNDR